MLKPCVLPELNNIFKFLADHYFFYQPLFSVAILFLKNLLLERIIMKLIKKNIYIYIYIGQIHGYHHDC